MSKKKMLIFAHYYAPDTASTGQILQDMAEGMREAFDITVICVVPSYTGVIEDRYKQNKLYYEEMNGIRLIRVRVPEFEKKNKISRIKNIISYFFGALAACRKSGKQDYILTISQPPILGGILGVLGKWQKKAKLVYCIQDYNPEQIKAVGYFNNKLILAGALALDKFSCRCSDLVITVGRDLVDTLKNRFGNKKVPNHVMINNWINEKEIYPLKEENEGVMNFKSKYGLKDKFIIMYSGNIGLYYDLENIVKVIGKVKPGTMAANGKEVVFAFVGAGAVLDKLQEYVSVHQMTNVYFIPYQEKSELIYSLNAADVHWCVNAKGIKGVSCPSKYYGISACSKPVLGVLEEGSEIRMLIDETNGGKTCEPGNYQAIEENIQWFIENAGSAELHGMGERGYQYLTQNLTKNISIEKYIEAIDNL